MNEGKILHDEAMDEDDEWAFWFDVRTSTKFCSVSISCSFIP